jgi:Zn-dependent peptidase ImmA (M78 family)
MKTEIKTVIVEGLGEFELMEDSDYVDPHLHLRILVEKLVRDLQQRYDINGAFTERDFYRICRDENIGIIESPHKFTFLMSLPAGDMFIVLSDGKHGHERLQAMLHELGHYFCGHERYFADKAFAGAIEELKFSASSDSGQYDEIEANLFAELATVP